MHVSSKEIPDLLRMSDGNRVDSTQWEKRRQEIIQILLQEEYGTVPPAPEQIEATVLSEKRSCYAGKGVSQRIQLDMELSGGNFSFPIEMLYPDCGHPVPFIVLLSFYPQVPNEGYPAEELLDAGVGVAMVYYGDLAPDNAEDYRKKLGTVWGNDLTSKAIGMWAWGAIRVCDYLQQVDAADKRYLAVVGHSRLGKTALLAGALDSRFSFVFSNESGCSGAAVSRFKNGEQISDITTVFPYWFCEKYASWIGKEQEMPFDQHFLLGAVAPRYLYVTSASEDAWADPGAEYLGCLLAEDAWNLLGMEGICCPDGKPLIEREYLDGSIGYCCRKGKHFFSRRDWQGFLRFMEQKIKKAQTEKK